MRLAGYNTSGINKQPMNGLGRYPFAINYVISWDICVVIKEIVRQMAWDVRNSTRVSCCCAWDVHQILERGFKSGWDVRQLVRKWFASSWHVTGGIVCYLHLRWLIALSAHDKNSTVHPSVNQSRLIAHQDYSTVRPGENRCL